MNDLRLGSVLKSYRLLLGPDSEITVAALNGLKPEAIKTIYWKKIKAIHPDRAHVVGLSEDELTSQSQLVNRAYDILLPYMQDIHHCRKVQGSSYPAGQGQQPPVKDHYHLGPLPKRKLRLVAYLYYRGIISWKASIDALVWQRRVRPRIGQLALEWNYFEPGEVTRILSNVETDDIFGQTAIRMNLLSNFQLAALLGKQASFNRKIGQYFLNINIFSPTQLKRLLNEFRRNNIRYYDTSDSRL